MQAYLRSQTGGPALRLDTSGGALDVTFVRLPRTDAEYAAQSQVAPAIADDLQRAGLSDRTKLYAVYYDGSAPGPTPSFALCGQGGRGATEAIAVVILHDPCGFDLNASRAGTPGAVEFVLLHEAMHAMGFVPSCAPHATQDGHVDDSPQDLMAAILPDGTPILDVNHDDYFQANRAGCLDLTQSRFLEGAGATVTVTLGGSGRGHVRSQLQLGEFGDIDCPGTCTTTLDSGQAGKLPLAATADPGYVFVRWEGACTGTQAICQLDVSRTTSATAIFAKAPVGLVVSVAGGGKVVSAPPGLSCPRTCTKSFPFGAKVRLRARPQAGWRFVAWSGACSGRVPCFVTLSHAASVRAAFRHA
jgi:hypothetical protein